MIKVGLKKELEKQRDKSKDNFDNILNDTKLLLESNANAEADALRTAGLDHQIKHVEKSKRIALEREQFEEEYGNLIFTKEEIKNICLRYDLRILGAKYFKAKLDTQISYKLKEFIDNHPEVGDRSDAFYIIAPSNAFDLNDRPAKPFLTIDPILLYKTPGQDKYVYIHKWGRDFTIFRRLRGMFFKSKESMWNITTTFWIIMISAFLGFTFDEFTGMWYQYLNLIWISLVGWLLAFATLSAMFNDGEKFENRTTEITWNSRVKRRK